MSNVLVLALSLCLALLVAVIGALSLVSPRRYYELLFRLTRNRVGYPWQPDAAQTRAGGVVALLMSAAIVYSTTQWFLSKTSLPSTVSPPTPSTSVSPVGAVAGILLVVVGLVVLLRFGDVVRLYAHRRVDVPPRATPWAIRVIGGGLVLQGIASLLIWVWRSAG